MIDEIGMMEAFSEKFASLIKDALDSPKPVIATVAGSGGGLIASVKNRPDARMFELTIANRDELKDEILEELEKVAR